MRLTGSSTVSAACPIREQGTTHETKLRNSQRSVAIGLLGFSLTLQANTTIAAIERIGQETLMKK
jgi:hypothetical protein